MSPKRTSLYRGIVYIYISNLVFSASQWAILLLLARRGGAALTGQFVFCLAVVSPAFMLTSLRLRSLQATDLAGVYRFGHYLAVAIVGNSVAMGVTVVLAFLLSGGLEVRVLMMLIGAAKALEAITETCYGSLQRREQLDLLAISRASHGVAQLLMFWVGFQVMNSVLWGAGLMLFYRGTVGVALDAYLMIRSTASHPVADSSTPKFANFLRSHRPLFQSRALWNLTRDSAPLAVTFLIASLVNNCPKYFLASFASDAALGVFGVFCALLTAGATITRAVNQATCTRMAQLYRSGRVDQFRRIILAILGSYVALSFVACLVVVWRGKQILGVMLGPEFALNSHVLLIITISGGVNFAAGLVDTGLIAIRRTNLLPAMSVLTGLLMICLSAFLIPRHGILAAATVLGMAKIPFVIWGLRALLQSRNGINPVGDPDIIPENFPTHHLERFAVNDGPSRRRLRHESVQYEKP